MTTRTNSELIGRMNTDPATITITVNIAAAERWEGNSEVRINIPVKDLGYVNPNSFSGDLARLIDEAIGEFITRNSEG